MQLGLEPVSKERMLKIVMAHREGIWGYSPPREDFWVGIFCGITNTINYVLGI